MNMKVYDSPIGSYGYYYDYLADSKSAEDVYLRFIALTRLIPEENKSAEATQKELTNLVRAFEDFRGY